MDQWSDAPKAEPTGRIRARYCLRCGREGPTGAHVCPGCGDALVERGYCPVCEQELPLPLGATCPKHDIELTEPPPPLGAPAEGAAARWVTVATLMDEAAADAKRLRLEAEGIPTFVDGARMSGLYSVATGGVKLQVPEPLAADARVLLSQSWAPVVPQDDLDDAWDELAPEPGTEHQGVVTGVVALVLFVLTVPMALVLIARLLR
jgi:hypothetical protein